ncbi:MAG: M20/M25/M40 family metallo-hydrolase [bacterium]
MKAKLLLLSLLLLGNSFWLFSQSCLQYNPGQMGSGSNPVINEILATIDKDSLISVMQSMVNLGTRFMYAENRREVAGWIASKFTSYGYSDVVLDSFKVVGETVPEDSVWQYNVVATFEGASAPGEIYIVSAHHDDYVNPDPHQPAPGADDNASGTAVALEIARVLKEKGFSPASTIRFVTFAAEELMGYVHYTGSLNYANKIEQSQEDLRLMVCNDMVAYDDGTPFEIWSVDTETGNSAWTADLTTWCVTEYTDLSLFLGPYPPSDGTFFMEKGYCVAGFQERKLNPFYHTSGDSVTNCTMDYCLEAAIATAAVLLHEQFTPVPQEPSCIPGKSNVTVTWKPTANAHVKAYAIYRSADPDSGFSVLAQTAGADSFYVDSTAVAGTDYYYYITSIDQDD